MNVLLFRSDIAFLLIESVAFDEAIVGQAVELYTCSLTGYFAKLHK